MITLNFLSKIRNLRALLLSFCVASLPFFLLQAQSTYTWSGEGDGINWSDPDNWAEAGLPSNGDHLVFTGPSGSATTHNDLLTSVGNLTITATGSNSWNFTGNSLTVEEGRTTFDGASGTVTYGLNTLISSGTRQFIVLNANKTVDITGLISGAEGIAIWHSGSTQGTIRFSNTDNSFTGNFTMRGARAEVVAFADIGENSSIGAGNQITLGTTASANSVRLAYVGEGDSSTNRALSLVWAGTGQFQRSIHNDSADNGNLSFTNTDTLNTNTSDTNRTLTFSGTSTGITTLAGLLSGRVGVRVLDNSGIVRLTHDNTYSFQTQVADGTLWIEGNQSGATGEVFVERDGRLGGGGIIGGETSIHGSLAPGGDAIRTLTIANQVTWHGAESGGTRDWQFRLGEENHSDHLAITGDAGDFLRGNEGDGNIFQFNFLGTGSTGEYTLITWTGETTFDAGDFSYVNLVAGHSGTFSIADSSLLFTVIPEPSTYLLGLGSVVLLVTLRRRSRIK